MATPRLAVARLEGADGRPLEVEVRSGARRLEPRPALIICHGFQASKDGVDFSRVAERMAVAGFSVLSFRASASVARDLADLATVVDYAIAQGANWVGLLGHGAGAGVVGSQAAQDARVKAIAIWAPEGPGATPVAVPTLVVEEDPLEKTVAFFSAALP